MDAVITPEPHFIPGYTGHCPQFRFRVGKTYGKLSHKLLIDPCTRHAPELIVTPPTQPTLKDYPTTAEIDKLKDRVNFLDPVYQHPIIPGYNGFIPNMENKVGKRFIAAATAGIAEHEQLMDLLRCEKHLLEHRDLLESGQGQFEAKLRERMIPRTKYRSPLIAVKCRSQAIKLEKCKEKKEPYTKFTVPHFMENENEEKYIVKGYAGYIPMALTRFGQSNKQLTNSALCEFTNNYHHRKSDEWCPMEMSGIASSFTSNMEQQQSVIYHRTIGMVPSYSGHVPGQLFSIGRTYGNTTIDAKRWLALHKD
ncbi:CIMIP2 protein GA14893-like [Cochliomyia hominivorax]